MWQDRFLRADCGDQQLRAARAARLLVLAVALGCVGRLFLLAGVAPRGSRCKHMTFFINSLCHNRGQPALLEQVQRRARQLVHGDLQPSARAITIITTSFQHDYRNGVKWWQWDPTKWDDLDPWRKSAWWRGPCARVPEDKILLAQLADGPPPPRARNWFARRSVPMPRLHELFARPRTPSSTRSVKRWTILKAAYAEKAGAMKAEYAERATRAVR